MKQRPILVAVIGYIIGILWGLYLHFSIVSFYILTIVTYNLIKKINKNIKLKTKQKTSELVNSTQLLHKLKIHKQIREKTKKIDKKETKQSKIKLISLKRYIRYAKLYINKKVILILVTSSIISNTITAVQNQEYKKQYQEGENIKIIGIVISQKTEKDYYNIYKIKILPKGKYNIYIQTKKSQQELEYGDKIEIQGEYSKPEEQRNYKGYDESKYFKTLKILGRVKVNKIEIIAKKQMSPILQLTNEINLKIKNIINKTFKQEKAAILNGLILGDKENIEEEIKEKYQTLSISHVLAISGMHIEYIIIGIQILLKNLIGKRKTKIATIIILTTYTSITGFSPSILRATIMGILTVGETLFYRKNNNWNSISISLLGILIYNPFSILDIGLQLSYLGTIGIIFFQSTILDILEKIIHKTENKIVKSIKQILSVTISAQIIIMPILLINFHTISIYSLIANLILSTIIGPIIIIAFIGIILTIIFDPIIKIFKPILSIGLEILNFISNLSKLPLSKIYIPTPNGICIILYFIIIFTGKHIYKIYTQYYINATQKRIKNLISLFRYKITQNKKKYKKYLGIIIIIFIIIQIIPQNLKIYFVDVGQGDCTFIITPKNKTILIDGGGSQTDKFDIGKKTLIPYILNRGYNKIDYVIISHFDQDHVRRNYYSIRRIRSKKYNNRKTI